MNSLTIHPLTSSHRVVDVDHVVLPAPGVGVLGGPIELVVLIHRGDDGTVQLQGPEHRRASGTSLESVKVAGAGDGAGEGDGAGVGD